MKRHEMKRTQIKATGLAALLVFGLLLSACSGAGVALTEPSPTATIEVTPTAAPTPAPTPAPKPTATPVPELSMEEEVKLLGIDDLDHEESISEILYAVYNRHGKEKVVFVSLMYNPGTEEFLVGDFFTGTILFTWKHAYEDGLDLNSYPGDKFLPTNDAIEGARLMLITSIGCIGIYLEHGVNTEMFNKVPLIQEWYDNRNIEDFFEDYMMTKEEVANFYIEAVKKEYRVTAAELDPANYTADQMPPG